MIVFHGTLTVVAPVGLLSLRQHNSFSKAKRCKDRLLKWNAPARQSSSNAQWMPVFSLKYGSRGADSVKKWATNSRNTCSTYYGSPTGNTLFGGFDIISVGKSDRSTPSGQILRMLLTLFKVSNCCSQGCFATRPGQMDPPLYKCSHVLFFCRWDKCKCFLE